MTDEVNLIRHFFPEISTGQINSLLTYSRLLKEWNTKINLVSRKDIQNLLAHHILYSLAPNFVFSFRKDERALDVGTGGGLPGIPLAITNPETKFHLIDRTGKKIHAIQQMIRDLNLKNVSAEQTSVEEHPLKYHYILGRGITRFPEFVMLVRQNLLKPEADHPDNGIIYLTGGDLHSDITTDNNIRKIPLSDFLQGDYFDTKMILYFPA